MTQTITRQSPRIDYRVPVELAQADLTTETRSVAGLSLNVSAGGMALGVPIPMPIGEPVICHVWVDGQKVSLAAEVTWSSPDPDPAAQSGQSSQVGLCFQQSEARDQARLNRLLSAATGPGQPLGVRFEGLDQEVLARGTVSDGTVRLAASLPILARGTPVDLRLAPDSDLVDGEVLDSRLVNVGSTPVLEVDICVSAADGPRARRQTFYGRSSKLKTLEQPVAYVGGGQANADAAAAGSEGEREATDRVALHGGGAGVDDATQRARKHTRRMWQPTPNRERGTWPGADGSCGPEDTARDPLPAVASVDTGPGAAAASHFDRLGRWLQVRVAAGPSWAAVFAAAAAAALTTYALSAGPLSANEVAGGHPGPAEPRVALAPQPVADSVSLLTKTQGGLTGSAPGATPAAAAPDYREQLPMGDTARALRVTANRQQTRIRVPLTGEAHGLRTHLWKQPVAVVAQWRGASVEAQPGTYRIGRRGIKHVSIVGSPSQPEVRVVTDRPVSNYSVTADAGWLEIRITPNQR